MLGRAVTFALVGLEPRRVEVEAHLRTGQQPTFSIVGLADRACQEAKHRVRSGVHSALLRWPGEVITVNLARAVRKADDREGRLLTRAQVRLDLDTAGLEADERERDRATEHTSTVWPAPSRECAAYVTTRGRRRSRKLSRPEGDSFARETKHERAFSRGRRGTWGKHGFPHAPRLPHAFQPV